ncbi:chitin binding peritrophin-A domain-containing protein [Sphingobacterium paucimobilis]|uniref:chitin binding peritrophin-A domain-containing protein n=1 Tax=Sphingobacterium paucimobilis TaxID=1385985 RepID=UPI00373FE246
MFNTAKADDWEIIIDGNFCDNRDDGVYGNLSDCRWYYQCFENRTAARQCSAGSF